MDGESSRHDKLESTLHDQSSEPRDVPLEYLRKITNDFSDKQLLGEGGFGKVYKGVLGNFKLIAVKKLEQLRPGILDRQFENEVFHLLKLKHPNIVRFLGYCYETQNECLEHDGKYIFAEKPHRLLCLEYLQSGSLDRYLSDESCELGWDTQYKIIRGICSGLHYLHHECQSKINASIIHLDLKPANILLDYDMVPKIADFGLSKLFDDMRTRTCATTLVGSLGYMAPEYLYERIITTKADIYSLGVIIIEMITGRKIGPWGPGTSSEEFVESVLKNWKNRLEAAPRYILLETYYQQIENCLKIGISCIKFDRRERPSTREIIECLNRWENAHHSVINVETPPENQITCHHLRCSTSSHHQTEGDGGVLGNKNHQVIPTVVQSIGVCYGMMGDNLPSSSDVVQLYRSKGINGMRIYAPNKQVLNALRDSGIVLILDVGNHMVAELAASPSNAASWVQNNVRPYYPAVNIKYVAVGNEVQRGCTQSILPAMQNVDDALKAAGLGSIKVSTSVSIEVVANSFPPSSGVFAQSYMTDVARFLSSTTGAPLLANLYPYFDYSANPRNISLGYATFQQGTTARDNGTGLSYTNLLDTMVDALYTALEKAGAWNVRVVISETGWPSAGGFGASVDNARKYNQGLIDHVGQGTPKRPGTLEAFIFAMFNENLKVGGDTEKNFGLFYPNGTPVYPIRF